MNDRDALDTARRLEELGLEIRSAELHSIADAHARFATQGNRAMRRARARAQRRRGR